MSSLVWIQHCREGKRGDSRQSLLAKCRYLHILQFPFLVVSPQAEVESQLVSSLMLRYIQESDGAERTHDL